MSNAEKLDQLLAEFAKKIEVTEFSFPSSVPIIGSIVSIFRRIWNNISTRWYVQHYAAQQHTAQQTLMELLVTLQLEHLQLTEQLSVVQANLDRLKMQQSASHELFSQDIELLARTLTEHPG